MPVLVAVETDLGRADPRALRREARQVLRLLHLTRAELSVVLVDDEAMRALNHRYRAKDRTTDVLSFPQDGLEPLPEGEPRILGDVVLCLPQARRQARSRHRGLHEELRRLLVHGVLHLLGHDHEEDDEARRMRREERRLLAHLRAAAEGAPGRVTGRRRAR
jgi:rRNA maturation RNase YbeY